MRLGSMIAGAIVAALLAWPLHAQSKDDGPTYQPKPEEIEKKRSAATLDRQYKRALEQGAPLAEPVKTDPWQNLRGTGDAKAKK